MSANPNLAKLRALATGCNGDTVRRLIVQPYFLLRFLEWWVSLAMWGVMASEGGFSNEAAFSYVVGFGVLFWLYINVIIMSYFYNAHSTRQWMYLLELVMDGVNSLLAVIAAIAAAVACDQSVPSIQVGLSLKKCSALGPYNTFPKYASFFAFLLTAALCTSTYSSLNRYRHKGGAAAVQQQQQQQKQ